MILRLDSTGSLMAVRVRSADVQLPTGVEAPGSNELVGPVHVTLPLAPALSVEVRSTTSRAGITQLTPLVAFSMLAVVEVIRLCFSFLAQMSSPHNSSRSLDPCAVDSSRGDVLTCSVRVADHSSLTALVTRFRTRSPFLSANKTRSILGD